MTVNHLSALALRVSDAELEPEPLDPAQIVSGTPRVTGTVVAVFLGGANGFVQVLGWLTWLACGALLTSMVSRSHDLPWPKALGAASVQLVALLVLFKLPVL